MQTTIIEAFLLAIDEATFQKMMNHLLNLEGFKFIGSPGSVIGKNKTSKGTPDSFFEDGEKFAFCEITTKERLGKSASFFDKLKEDVAHCFNTKKTGIDPKSISKVILAFNGDLLPVEFKELKELVKSYNPDAELIIYSIQQIPFRLLYYPGLADKYIPGVKTTSGSLYMLPDFLESTARGLQPSLVNEFVGREKEIEAIKERLDQDGVVIVSGPAGVGKSKIGVRLAEIYEKQGFEPRIISSSPVPLWEDLQNFILPGKKYFILFDDANKALTNLDYLMQFLQSREAGSIKVIITVRDYVRGELNRVLIDKRFSDFNLSVVEDEQIRKIVNALLPENHSLDRYVMERILSLAKGNARLALMAAKTIIEKNDIEILRDITSLYEEYFKKVQSEVDFIKNPAYLEALGLLSFFGVLDRKDENLKEKLTQLGINWDRLWEIYLELEKSELVDVFYKEAVKISDQVLSTYVFYKAFVEKSSAVINFSAWIEMFLEHYENKINKSLIDSINTFGFSELREEITSVIIPVQKAIASNNSLSFKFFSVFWFYREYDTLLFIKQWVDSLEQEEMDISKIRFSYGNNEFTWASEYVNLLKNFWHHETPLMQDAIQLTMQLIYKQPSKIPEILKHLHEHIGFQRFDYKSNYTRQQTFFDVLLNSATTPDQQFIVDGIFLSLAGQFLSWEYTQVDGGSNGTFMIYNFALTKTSGLMDLRQKIVVKSISLFKDYEKEVFDILNKYVWAGKNFDQTVYAEEQAMITHILKTNFVSDNYAHSKLVKEYVDTLEEYSITVTEDWSDFIKSDLFEIARIFTWNFDDIEGNFTERQNAKDKQIADLIKGKDLPFIEHIFQQLQNIIRADVTNHNTHQIVMSITSLFRSLADQDKVLYLSSLELIMQGKYDFELYGNIISYAVTQKTYDVIEIYNHINRYDYPMKRFWKQAFFEALEKESINEFLLQEFIGFVHSVNQRIHYYDLSSYDKFSKLFNQIKDRLPHPASEHTNVVSYITEIIMLKTATVQVAFDSHTCQNCIKYFADKIPLLKQVYYYQKSINHNYDHDGQEMEAISSLEPSFIIEYLQKTTRDTERISTYFESMDFEFIWDLPNHEEIINQAFAIIMPKAPVWSNFEHPLNTLFKGCTLSQDHADKARAYIRKFIAAHYNSTKAIQIIFNIVTYTFPNEILDFFKEYLLLNKSTEVYRGLWLERNNGVAGSRVPQIEGHIQFINQGLQMIKSLPNTLDYAAHISHWEQELEYAKKDKEAELKRDFTGWF